MMDNEKKVCIVSCNYYEYEEKVNKLLDNGWELHGYPFIRESIKKGEPDWIRQVMKKNN